jgi:UDP-glucose 4-epimerase
MAGPPKAAKTTTKAKATRATASSTKKPPKAKATATAAATAGPAPALPTRVPGSDRVVAVVGAFGVLGRRLLGRLESDPAVDKIVAVDVRSGVSLFDESVADHAELLLRHPKVTAHILDLTTPGADRELAELLRAEDAGSLFQLAMLSTPTHHTEMAHELETVGTHYVLNAVAGSGIMRLMCLSSAMIYGARPDNPAFLDEDAPLRPPPSRALKDKAEADADARRFASEHPEIAVCVARLGAMVPTAKDHFWTRILSRRLVPAVLGYDPLLQLLHPDDAVDAMVALWRVAARGPVNVVGRGYLPLSHIITRLGRVPLSLTAGVGQSLIGALWQAQLIEMPAHFLGFLRWPWLCDDHRLRSLTGFVPRHDLTTVLNILASSEVAAGSTDDGARP